MLLEQQKAGLLLKNYNIKMIDSFTISKGFNYSQVKFPAVLKVDSPQVIHKSDLGLVFLDLKNVDEVKQKIALAENILKKNNIVTYKLILQPMIKGVELIIGMKRDKVFGPVIIFGIGGVFVEVMKDISMGISPIDRKDCIFMIENIKGKKLLEGYRNTQPVNKEKLIDMLMSISKMSLEHKEILEIDFNPVVADSNDAAVVDARIIIGDN